MSDTRRGLLKQASEKLAAGGIETAALDARLLFQAVSGLRHEDIVKIAADNHIDLYEWERPERRERFVTLALSKAGIDEYGVLAFEDSQSRYNVTFTSHKISIAIYAISSLVGSGGNKLREDVDRDGVISSGDLKIRKSELKALKKFRKFHNLKSKPGMIVMGQYS